MGLSYIKKSITFLVILFICLQLKSQNLDFEFKYYSNKIPKGYLLIVPFKMKNSGKTASFINKQLIINTEGDLIFYRKAYIGSDFKLQPNGYYTHWGNEQYFVLNQNLEIIDSVKCVNGLKTDSHDFLILKNGNYLLYGKSSTIKNVNDIGWFKYNTAYGSKQAKVKFDVIQELNKQKQLVWEWNSEPYFDLYKINPVYLQDTANIDVTHFNSIDVNKSGNILVSSRYYDEVFKINKQTKQLEWRFGGPYNDLKLSNDTILFKGQHDARFIGNNRISLFDNGYGKETDKHNARGCVYEIDEKSKTINLKSSYANKERIISSAAGNYQVISKKLSLINYGQIENQYPNVMCELINEKQQSLLSVHFNDTLGNYRTFYYKKLPFLKNRPTLVCEKKGEQLVYTTYKKHKYYQWFDGSTNPTFTKNRNEKRKVFVFVSDDGINYYRSL